MDEAKKVAQALGFFSVKFLRSYEGADYYVAITKPGVFVRGMPQWIKVQDGKATHLKGMDFFNLWTNETFTNGIISE